MDQFWRNLVAGHCACRTVPADRWDAAALYDPRPGQPGKSYGRWGGFLDEIDRFDAAFFQLQPAVAAKLDPQQRLALEVAHHAMEDAGHAGPRRDGCTAGVFVGAREGDYHTDLLPDLARIDPHLMMGQDTGMLAARIAHALNLDGPALTISAACASSGVALHQACQSLHRGECDLALVGGISLMTTPQRFLMHSQSGLLSPAGRCRAYDDGADGMVLGEAAAFVVLRRLVDAQGSGDQLHAVIRGSGTNHNGHTPAITRPSAAAQTRLIRRVLQESNVDPRSIRYVEGHGTGTRQGDAIELMALDGAYGVADEGPWCGVGSVKSNIGHTIAASGIVGLIKVALCLRHRYLPPTLHVSTPNALLDTARSPLRLQTMGQPWGLADQPRR
ncbi:MAG TPA: polyketide synthase, partial [Myxococcota bacterium]|nr:polyketide synthase [Myxococcota bacterium]